MPECDYCDASFENDGAYDTHLRLEHESELGAIDRRRIGADDDDEPDDPNGLIILGSVFVMVGSILVFTMFLPSDGVSGADVPEQPTDLGEFHYHGTMEMIVNGQRVDFSQDQYQFQDSAFHFEISTSSRTARSTSRAVVAPAGTFTPEGSR